MAPSRSAGKPDTRGQEILGELLSSRVRAAVLSFLIAREESRFSLTELAKALGMSISSVQHECYKLERLGVLKGQREGASRRYWLDRDTPWVPVLMWLVVTVIGEQRVLHYALVDIHGLAGALLTPGERPSVVLIGDVDLQALADVQERVAKVLQVQPRDVDVSMYGQATWQDHLRNGHPAVQRLRDTAPIVLHGDLSQLLPS